MQPQRSQVRLISPASGASTDEAAAIAAAIEQFIAETAPQPENRQPARDRWRQAALLEGVLSGSMAEDDVDAWLNT